MTQRIGTGHLHTADPVWVLAMQLSIQEKPSFGIFEWGDCRVLRPNFRVRWELIPAVLSDKHCNSNSQQDDSY